MSVARPRLLVIDGDDERTIFEGWPGDVAWASAADALAGPARLPGATFDAVALPGTLQPFLPAKEQSLGLGKLLPALPRLLAVGGVVVGHMRHGLSPRVALACVNYRLVTSRIALASSPYSAWRLVHLLGDAGLEQAECYYVRPGLHDPLALVPACGAAVRDHCRQVMDKARSTMPLRRYLPRQALVSLGLWPLLQEDLFFWARRSC